MLFPEPETPTIETNDFSLILRFIFFNIVLSSLYAKLTLLKIISSLSLFILFTLFLSSGISSISNILSLADIPFIAMWKNEPKSLKGIKNSAESIIIVNVPARLMFPFIYSSIDIITPKAAPPYAIMSIIVVEFNCINSRFIVAILNFSASIFISSFFFSSALYIFKVVSPCTSSKNISPKSL